MAFVAVLEPVINASVSLVTMAFIVKRNIMNAFLHPARMLPPAEILSIAMNVYALLNMKDGTVNYTKILA